MTFAATWQAIKSMPRALWTILVLKLLTCYSIFSLMAVLSVYLNKTHHYDDQQISIIIGLFSFISSCACVFTGPLADKLGYRNAIALGLLVFTFGTGILSIAFSREVLFSSTFVVIPIGNSLIGLALSIAAVQLSSSANRDVLFSALYAQINVGASLAFFSYDFVRFQVVPEARRNFYFKYLNTSERVLIGVSAFISFCSMIISICGIKSVVVSLDGRQNEEPITPLVIDPNTLEGRERYFHGPWRQLKKALSDPMLRKMTLFNTCLVPLNTFYSVSQTSMPNWLLRVLGPDAPIGSIMAINGVVVILWSIPASMLFANYDKYRMIVLGSLCAAISIFLFGMAANVFSICVAWIAFSLCEATYSPRTVPFALVNYPKDQEGLYLTIAGAPATFISLPLTWFMGGMFLEMTCPTVPSTGEESDRCLLFWVGNGLLGSLTFVLLILFSRYIYSQEVRANVSSQTKHYSLDESASKAEVSAVEN